MLLLKLSLLRIIFGAAVAARPMRALSPVSGYLFPRKLAASEQTTHIPKENCR